MDLRDLDFTDEIDFVLNLNDGAVGYFETEEENHRTLGTISRALKPGGRNLVQLPNVLYARDNLPQRSLIPSSIMVERSSTAGTSAIAYMEGAMIPLRSGEVLDGLAAIEFRRRLYTVHELRDIYASAGMSLERTCHGSGRPKGPTESPVRGLRHRREELAPG